MYFTSKMKNTLLILYEAPYNATLPDVGNMKLVNMVPISWNLNMTYLLSDGGW